MMKSMFSGVSGLKTHQIRMDVIGNNIANVNTVGFKSSRMSFQEIYSQTVRGAGASSGGVGGTNPQQIGLGVTVGSIDVNHSKGSIQRTDSATDIMVDGSGFFVLSNDESAQNKFYSRAGNFALDNLGFLVAPNGFKVLGMDGKAVQINRSETKNATATTKSILKGNLNTTETNYQTDLKLYDSLGALHQVDVKFGANTAVPAAGATPAYSMREVSFEQTGGVLKVPATDKLFIKFDATGVPLGFFSGATAAAAATTPIAAAGLPLTMPVAGAADLTLTVSNNLLYENGDSTATGAKPVMFQRAQDTDIKATRINGNSAGQLNSFTIAANGEVVGVFTNGEKLTLSTIQIADFDNPPGLMKMGANMFAETNNSGVPKFGQPGQGSFGALAPGALEMSNVDLSQEFTDMITTQRGFQANSKIITTTDEMLQELVNLKR